MNDMICLIDIAFIVYNPRYLQVNPFISSCYINLQGKHFLFKNFDLIGCKTMDRD